MTTYTVSAGVTTDNGITLNPGDFLTVDSGGTVSFITVNSGAIESVGSGGTASDTTVNAGGVEQVFAGGTASGTTVNATGFETVNSGGTAVGTTVNHGGFQNVDAGGTADATTVNSGGIGLVLSGGTASGIIVNFGGTNTVATSGVASATTVNSGGFEGVQPGGSLSGSTVSSGGIEVVDSGSVVTDTDLLAGGRIDVPSLIFAAGGTASVNLSTDLLTVTETSGTYTQHLSGSYAGEVFHLAADSVGGTIITAACYAEGTHLATPSGESPVQALCAGDDVLALQDGAWTPARVRWIGRTTLDLTRHPNPEQAAPICIRAHAVAEGAPARDLLVSPDHALLLDGRLIQARALQNGATVVQVFPARITYLHVELDRHAVLLAENLAAESYLDTGNRALFAGEAGVRPLHPGLASAAAWDARACAKLHLTGPVVAAAHARVLLRAVALGWSVTADPGLRILADGRQVLAFAAGCGAWQAMLPAGTRQVQVASRCFIPAWFAENDRRLLGVAIAALRVGGRKLPHAAFAAGWHAAEAEWRWTDGAARLTLPALARPTPLRLRLAAAGARYWTAAAAAETVAA